MILSASRHHQVNIVPFAALGVLRPGNFSSGTSREPVGSGQSAVRPATEQERWAC